MLEGMHRQLDIQAGGYEARQIHTNLERHVDTQETQSGTQAGRRIQRRAEGHRGMRIHRQIQTDTVRETDIHTDTGEHIQTCGHKIASAYIARQTEMKRDTD
jgi:hypothetical protein